jgi:hypothetical protein
VLRAGKPVAGAAVELCDSPLTMFTRTPCESSTASLPRHHRRRRDVRAARRADRHLRLRGQARRQWIILIGGDCCTALTAGGTYDVGAITLD